MENQLCIHKGCNECLFFSLFQLASIFMSSCVSINSSLIVSTFFAHFTSHTTHFVFHFKHCFCSRKRLVLKHCYFSMLKSSSKKVRYSKRFWYSIKCIKKQLQTENWNMQLYQQVSWRCKESHVYTLLSLYKQEDLAVNASCRFVLQVWP